MSCDTSPTIDARSCDMIHHLPLINTYIIAVMKTYIVAVMNTYIVAVMNTCVAAVMNLVLKQ